MEKNMNESLRKNGALQIIKHPCYQSNGKCLLSWFDIRVFYVRVNNFMVHGYTPEYLTLNHIPLNPDTVLEVNGKSCSLQSCRLRRNRVDKKFEEVTFVSTDSIRLSGSVKFEVFDGEDIILSGTLDNDFEKWSMSCESMIYGRNGFTKVKETVVCDSVLPMIEVYVAGSFSGTPIILTKTLPLFKTTKSYKEVAPQHDLQLAGYSGYDYKHGSEDYESSLYLSRSEYMEGEDGELTWFNAGVRVGVGIGLGVFLGVGVGVGLLVRTYQSATRNFRRRFWNHGVSAQWPASPIPNGRTWVRVLLGPKNPVGY